MNQTDYNARVIALNLSVTLAVQGKIPPEAIVNTADEFFSWTTSTAGTNCNAPSTAVPTTAPAPAKRAERAKRGEKEGPVKPAQSEEQLVTQATTAAAEAAEKADDKPVVSKQDVSAAVAKMLEANKRTDAISLLKKYGAQSVSGIHEADYAAFVADAQAIVGSEADLAA